MTIWVSLWIIKKRVYLCLFRMVHFFPESKKQIRPKPFSTLPYNLVFVMSIQTMPTQGIFYWFSLGWSTTWPRNNINTHSFNCNGSKHKRKSTELINHIHSLLRLPLFQTYPNSSLSSGWTATIWAIFFPKG